MNFGQNLYNWFLSNAQSLVLMAIVVIGIYLGFKREFSKLIGFLVVALVAVAEALKQLPEQSRNIVLMFFFLDMSDSEIGEKLNINRSTSYRHRRNSLEEIKKQLKEKKTNEK